jgi:hypothetical protein
LPHLSSFITPSEQDALNGLNVTVSDTSSAAVEEDEEENAAADWHTAEWRQQKKHVFILSLAGKPIYTRYVVSKILQNKAVEV